MPVLSERSHNILATCDSRLIRIMNKAIEGPLDFAVISGHRGEEEQNEYYRTGKSYNKYPFSEHNVYPSNAVDIGFWDRMLGTVDWGDEGAYQYMAGQIMYIGWQLGIPLVWGGNWDGDDDFDKDQSLYDYGHFHLLNPRNIHV